MSRKLNSDSSKLKAVISIHGLLSSPGGGYAERIDSSILVLHGWDDPTVSLEALLIFTREMTNCGADWQLHCYGQTKHAFTFVGADIPELGIKYNKKAHARSQQTVDNFFQHPWWLSNKG